MVVNDNVGLQDKRGALESIASMLAPTSLQLARGQLRFSTGLSAPTSFYVQAVCHPNPRLPAIGRRFAVGPG
ncbi:hypothetical protein DM828_15325 [Pseudomonas umsongensis]|nr:hypothetical protein [Pseudomonas umsongensis]